MKVKLELSFDSIEEYQSFELSTHSHKTTEEVTQAIEKALHTMQEETLEDYFNLNPVSEEALQMPLELEKPERKRRSPRRVPHKMKYLHEVKHQVHHCVDYLVGKKATFNTRDILDIFGEESKFDVTNETICTWVREYMKTYASTYTVNTGPAISKYPPFKKCRKVNIYSPIAG